MGRFRYIAFDSDGHRVSSELEARNVAEVLSRLDAAGLTVESVGPVDAESVVEFTGHGPDSAEDAIIDSEPSAAESTTPSHPPTTEPSTTESPTANPPNQDSSSDDEPVIRPPEALKPRELEELTGHLADLTQSDLPLASGLRALAADVPDGRLRRGLLWIAGELERGRSLEHVLDSYDVPAELRALIRAGARTGQTGDVLGQYVIHVRNAAENRRSAMEGLGYACVLLLLAIAVGLVIVGWLVPQFKQIYEDFGTALPGITMSLIFISDYVWHLLAIVGFMAALTWVFYRFALPESTRWQILRCLPIYGPMMRWSSMARFTHLLALLVDQKVPMPEAILMAGETVRDGELQTACRRLARDVQAGLPLVPAAEQVRGFPAMFVQTLSWERNSEAFPEALHAVAAYFESRSRRQSRFLVALVEPLLIVFIGCSLFYIVLALFMPLIKLLNDLS